MILLHLVTSWIWQILWSLIVIPILHLLKATFQFVVVLSTIPDNMLIKYHSSFYINPVLAGEGVYNTPYQLWAFVAQRGYIQIIMIEWHQLWQNDQNTPCQDRVKANLTVGSFSRNKVQTVDLKVLLHKKMMFVALEEFLVQHLTN